MAELVFCGRCKHRIDGGWEPDQCRANPTPASDWLAARLSRAMCFVKNANNDCLDFEAGWWTRLGAWVRSRDVDY